MKNVIKRVVSLSLTLCLLMTMVLTTIPALAAENEGMYKPSATGEILYWGSNAVSAKNQTVKFTARLNSPSDNYNKSQFLISLRAESMGNPWDGANTGYWIYVDNTSVLVRYNNATLFKTDDDSFSAVPGYADTRWTLTAMEEAAGSRKALWSAEHEYEFSAINEDGGVRLIAKVDGNVILNWLDTNSTVNVAGGFSIRTEDVYELYASKLSFTGDDGAELNMLAEENIGKLSTNTTGFGGYANPVAPEVEEEPANLYKPSVAGEILYWGSTAVSAKNQTVKFTARLNSPTNVYSKTQFWVSLRAESMGNPWDGANTGYWIYVDNTSVLVRYNNATIFKTDDDSFADVPGYADTRWTLTAMVNEAGSLDALWSAEHEYEFSAINEEGGVRLIGKVDGNVILNWLDTNSTVNVAGGFSIRTEDVYELYATDLTFTGDDGVEMNMFSTDNVGKLSTNTTGFGGYVNPDAPEAGEEPSTEPSEEPSTEPAEKTGLLYKPSATGEILYWGSTAVSAKNQTIKFTARLNSPTDNYNKSQIWVSLRAESMGNPWDGANTGYWIMIDNTATHVRYNGVDIFYTCDDQYASVPGYEDTRWTLTAMEEAAGSRKALWSTEHEYEFSAINEDGGVRLIAKVDGKVVLNWLDTQSRVNVAGGFSVRTEDVYELYATDLTFTGDDGVELNLLGTTNADKLDTNTTGFGGYVNPVTGDVGVGVAVALLVATGTGSLVIKKKKD